MVSSTRTHPLPAGYGPPFGRASLTTSAVSGIILDHMDAFENLALWYLRLNGYFTMANFIVHGDSAAAGTVTEADIVGVRFPFSQEFDENDDDKQLVVAEKIDFVLADAASGLCKLNGPWTKRDRKPMEYILKRIGFLEDDKVRIVANGLYENGRSDTDDRYSVRMVCFGCSKSTTVLDATQILWEDVVSFMAKRFAKYHDRKRDHSQWDPFGWYLWDELNPEKIPGLERIPTVESLMKGWDQKSSERFAQSQN